MGNESWKCHYCGREGGFKLLGKGIIECSGCQTRHIVLQSGQIIQVIHLDKATEIVTGVTQKLKEHAQKSSRLFTDLEDELNELIDIWKER